MKFLTQKKNDGMKLYHMNVMLNMTTMDEDTLKFLE